MSKIAVLGAGVIGASWTSLFLAAGHDVWVYDLDPRAKARLQDDIDQARPTLEALGLDGNGALKLVQDPTKAVDDAVFIQENVPERIEIKHGLYRTIEPVLAPDCVIASSASGLMLSELQGGFADPGRLILGHPFNPPHLIPLVELMANARTDDGVIERAEEFYRSLGKVTIRVRSEVPGHVANRLQAALWREAIHLVNEGVASVEDVDKAVWAGPGLRWAAMGPTTLFHLGAGPGGIDEFCSRYAPSFHRWWDDLGSPTLDDPTRAALTAGIDDAAKGSDTAQLSANRDALIQAMLTATRPLRS